MNESSDADLQQWINLLNPGDDEAINVLCKRYFERVAKYAKNVGVTPAAVFSPFVFWRI